MEASSSPVPSSSKGGAELLPSAEGTPTASLAAPSPGDGGTADAAKPASMRGRKKHKCAVCGNIAKSRCPFHSCKGCCVKAKNPCHIHVVKSNAPGESGQNLSVTPPTHVQTSASSGKHSHLNDSLRLRTFRTSGIITRKEAGLINFIRFQKLRHFKDSILETEDHAFDRYMQGMSLLETIFSGDRHNLQGLSSDGHLMIEGMSGDEQVVDFEQLSAGLQTRLRTNAKRKEAFKQKLRRTIDRSLQKLNKGDQVDEILENEDPYMGISDIRRDAKRIKVQSVEGKERLRKMDVFNSIIDKVKLIETQEDYESCLKLFQENFLSQDVAEKLSKVICALKTEETPDKAKLSGAGLKDKFDSIVKGSFNKEKVDSCGVVRSWWSVNSDPDSLQPLLDIPVTSLETL